MESIKKKWLKEAYDAYIDLMLYDFPIDRIGELAVDDVTGYGTTVDEKILEIKRLEKIVGDQREQGAGIEMHVRITPVHLRISPNEDIAIYMDESEITLVIDDAKNVIPLRLTSVFEFNENTWKLVHLHGSKAVETEGDTWHLEEWKQLNEKLKKQVEEQTAELIHKNRELEIETALEKVRAVAMGMQKPDDILKVCQIISEQLELLKVTDIRNIQVAIINESKKNYLNFQYFAAYTKKVFEVTEYEHHPTAHAMVLEMQKTANSFFSGEMKGKELKDFKEWRKKYDQYPDPILDKSPGLFYYFYSIGQGGLGLTTYKELNGSGLEIFKRFHKVFTLAYKRFKDIELALEQAKEAQVEASLERVRAVAMAMRKLADLSDIGKTIFADLKSLGFESIRNTEIVINNNERETVTSYHYSDYGMEEIIEIGYKENPIVKKWAEDLKKAEDAFVSVSIPKKEIKSWDQYRMGLGYKSDPKMASAKGVQYYSYSTGLGALSISTWQMLSDDQIKILERFRNVFRLSYQRYKDIETAEAQARKAQIEASLEKVRARSMAMQKSHELADLSLELVKQVQALGIDTWFCAFNIYDEDGKGSLEWGSNGQGTFPKYRTPREGVFPRYYESGQQGESLLVNEIDEKECPAHYEYLCTLPGVGEQLLKMKADGIPFPTSQIDHVAFFKYGYIIFITFEPVPESHDIFKRFAKVFQQTYTRFLDLQKAEAQAREAQIEAALEKVRSRSLAMQKPDELKEVASLLRKEMGLLGVEELETSSIYLVNKEETQCWYAIKDVRKKGAKLVSDHMTIQLMDTWVGRKMEAFYHSRKNQTSIVMKGDYRKEWIDYAISKSSVFKGYQGNDIPERTYHLKKFAGGFMGAASPGEISSESWNLLQRSAKVFSLAYTRFKDLQQAAERAREAQIELALEKIRSRTMGMQKAEELHEVVAVVVEKLLELGVILDKNGVVLCTYFKDSKDVLHWISSPDYSFSGPYLLPYFDHVIFNDAWGSKENGDAYFSKAYSVDEKNSFWTYAFEHSDYRHFPDDFKKWVFQNDKHSLSFAWAENSAILIPSHTGVVPSGTDIEILKRFAKVFEQAYTRFLDLQKAEAQAKEVKIQLALEKVRMVALGLNSSTEMLEVAKSLYIQLLELGFSNIRNAIIDIKNGETDTFTDYDYSHEMSGTITQMSYHDDPTLEGQFKKMATTTNDFFELVLEGKELEDLKRMRIKNGEAPDPRLDNIDVLTYNLYSFGNGAIGISNFGVLSAEEKSILNRFSNVFALAYKRYTDLASAEAQAREIQVELALERTRAMVANMQNSEELLGIMVKMRAEFVSLGHEAHYFWQMKWEDDKYLKAMTSGDGTQIGMVMELPRKIHGEIPLLAAWEKSKEPTVVYVMDVPATLDYVHKMAAWGDFKRVDPNMPTEEDIHHIGGLTYVMARTLHGEIGYSLPGMVPNPPEEAKTTLVRFAGVFDLAYRRFEDLQKSEEQNRETQIELALERVRAKTMAMQKSEELADVIAHLFIQLEELSIKTYRCNLAIVDTDKHKCRMWSTTNEGGVIPVGSDVPLTENPQLKKLYAAWKKQVGPLVFKITGKKRLEWTNYIRNFLSFAEYKPENIDKDRILNQPAIFSNFFFRQGFFVIHTITDLDAAAFDVLERFAKVFEQTYTRFLDLLKAEAATREARIEASLERIRSKALGMQKSTEVGDMNDLLFDEFEKMGIEMVGCGISVINEETDYCEQWRARQLGTVDSFEAYSYERMNQILSKNVPGIHTPFIRAWKKRDPFYKIELKGTQRDLYLNSVAKLYNYDKSKQKNLLSALPESFIVNYIFYKKGWLSLSTKKQLTDEEISFSRRFVEAFDFAHTRFLDLKQAEDQAREAVKQASLDRIRGQIASMRNTQDLQQITPLIWQELITLEIPFFRCGLFIIDDKKKKVEVYLTTPDGKPLGVLNLATDENEHTKNTVDSWRKNEVYQVHWSKKQFAEWTMELMKLGQINSPESYQGAIEPPESLYLHFIPFAQGMLYVGNNDQLAEEKIKLVMSVANAFSYAYARYEDFVVLEEAKHRVENALSELKATQAQLIHAEKMASLGELTAGIAHEIQNPLNFVNNFSEVSADLMEELDEEMAIGNTEEVNAIAKDLKQNLQKITEHGKRASFIVKGMLEHSRTNTGEKKPTDINALADEYLRLAYHGLRVKDKSFNADFKTEFDESLPKIKVISQDLGRVLLNLINNAFYACAERSRSATSEKAMQNKMGYKPKVIVSTKNLEGLIEIQVKDNGNGIPKQVKDKIFQPFFTTKPTGQGTGLGLSLSYDIITKGHGGEIEVISKEGEGTEFIIQLPVQ